RPTTVANVAPAKTSLRRDRWRMLGFSGIEPMSSRTNGPCSEFEYASPTAMAISTSGRHSGTDTACEDSGKVEVEADMPGSTEFRTGMWRGKLLQKSGIGPGSEPLDALQVGPRAIILLELDQGNCTLLVGHRFLRRQHDAERRIREGSLKISQPS